MFASRVALVLASVALASTAMAAKSYQVTGPVLDVTDTTITVEKGKNEKWEIARDANTKVTGGEVKKGDKVTVYYSMSASEIEVKGDKKAADKGGKAEKKK